MRILETWIKRTVAHEPEEHVASAAEATPEPQPSKAGPIERWTVETLMSGTVSLGADRVEENGPKLTFYLGDRIVGRFIDWRYYVQGDLLAGRKKETLSVA